MAARFSQDLLPHLKPIDFAIEDPDNARLHPEENLDEIRRSFEAHGQVEPLVYWVTPDGRPVIKAGSGRLRVAKALGWTQIAMIEYKGTERQAMDFALAANRAPELAKWDDRKLNLQLSTLGISWKPTKIDWAPAKDSFVSPPTITVVPAKEEPKPRDRKTITVEVTESCRVADGDLWILGKHRVSCTNPNDARAVRLLCSGQHPSVRYVTVPPDTRPRWWLTAGLRTEGNDGYWNGWNPLRLALDGERTRAGWSIEDVADKTRDERAAQWFVACADWEPMPKDAYEALAAAGQELGVFAHPYEALKAVVDKLQSVQDRDVEALEPLFNDVGADGSALVLGSILPAALVAAERAGVRVYGALADAASCDQAISFWEQYTGRTAEKG